MICARICLIGTRHEPLVSRFIRLQVNFLLQTPDLMDKSALV